MDGREWMGRREKEVNEKERRGVEGEEEKRKNKKKSRYIFYTHPLASHLNLLPC